MPEQEDGVNHSLKFVLNVFNWIKLKKTTQAHFISDNLSNDDTHRQISDLLMLF